jgi:type IV secretion system protein VirB6
MDPLAYPIFLLMSDTIGSAFETAAKKAYTDNAALISAVSAAIITCVLMLRGLKIVLGSSDVSARESFIAAVKFGVIIAFINGSAVFNNELANYAFDVRDAFVEVISGKTGGGANLIYTELGKMNAAFAVANAVNPDSAADSSAKSMALNLSLLGQAAPVVLGAAMVLVNEIAFRIGLLLLPFAILCIGFTATNGMFFGWVKSMIGISVSMALLAITITIAANVTVVFVGAMTAGSIIGGDVVSELQQGMMSAGYGVVLTILIVTVPPMANRFVGGGVDAAISNNFAYMNASSPGSMGPNAPPPQSQAGSSAGVSMPSANMPSTMPSAGSSPAAVNPGVSTPGIANSGAGPVANMSLGMQGSSSSVGVGGSFSAPSSGPRSGSGSGVSGLAGSGSGLRGLGMLPPNNRTTGNSLA